MKLCMIGTRGHFGYVLESLPHLPDVEMAGICAGADGDDLSRLRQWCAANGRRPAEFADYLRMLDECGPDVVCVDGPFEKHAEMCVEAFGRGIHVFSEKPVATTFVDLERVKSAYGSARVQFAGMMGLRYDPAFYTAWTAVRAGAVGRIRLIDTRKSYKLGERPGFYRRRETYGGTIPWVGSHSLDWVLWFSGEQCRRVYAVHSRRDNRGHGNLEVSALCVLTLTNEVLASASIDFLRPATAPTHGDDRIRVVGMEGVIEVRGGRVFLIRAAGSGEEELAASCERRIFQDFVGQIEGRGRSLVTADETIGLTEVCLLARQSADEGREVVVGGGDVG